MKSLSDKFITVTIELKNDLEITGKLTNVDSSLNVSLSNISVSNPEKYPQLVIIILILIIKNQLSSKTCFIRGNTVRYIHFNKKEVDLDLLEEVCKKEATKTLDNVK